jgi:hypothetical protein
MRHVVFQPTVDGEGRRRFLTACSGLAAGATGVASAAVSSGSVTQSLAALRPNESVLLGTARVEGELNETARRFDLHRTGPRARNYCLKMVWSPRRKTAVYLGANHAVPHRLNDVWEFDLAAMRWTLLYGPDLPRDYKGLGPDASDVVFRDGILRTLRGGPAIIGHTWSGVTYDPKWDRVVFMNAWPADVDAAIARVGGNAVDRYTGPPVWAFDPNGRRWEPVKSPAPHPRPAFGGLMEYVPELGGSIWHMNNWRTRQTWLFDAVQNRWSDLRANRERGDFAKQAPGAEMVGYHDPARRLLVVRAGARMHHFDTERRRWEVLDAPSSDGRQVPEGHAARSIFVRDAGTGRGIFFDSTSRALWAYDPSDGQWSEVKPFGPPVPDGLRPLCYADSERQVIVAIDDTKVWAYRVTGRG